MVPRKLEMNDPLMHQFSELMRHNELRQVHRVAGQSAETGQGQLFQDSGEICVFDNRSADMRGQRASDLEAGIE